MAVAAGCSDMHIFPMLHIACNPSACKSLIVLTVRLWNSRWVAYSGGVCFVGTARSFHQNPVNVVPIAPSIHLLFVAGLVVPDEEAPRDGAVRLGVVEGLPDEVAIIPVAGLYMAKYNVAGKDIAVTAGHDGVKKALVPAENEGFERPAAGSELHGFALEQELSHHVVSLVDEVPP